LMNAKPNVRRFQMHSSFSASTFLSAILHKIPYALSKRKF
jgi:hypothetical protein